MDPFPGDIGQIVQAKILDEKPKFPSEFPAVLKEMVNAGWSQKPRERPGIEEFRSALSLMLKSEDQGGQTIFDNCPTFPEKHTVRLESTGKEGKPIKRF